MHTKSLPSLPPTSADDTVPGVTPAGCRSGQRAPVSLAHTIPDFCVSAEALSYFYSEISAADDEGGTEAALALICTLTQ